MGGSLTQKFKFHRGYNDEKPTMAKNIHTHTYNVYTRTFGRAYYFLFSFQFLSFVRLPDMITKKNHKNGDDEIIDFSYLFVFFIPCVNPQYAAAIS